MSHDNSNAPFRQTYLGYEEMTALLHRWAETWPDLARVQSLPE